jgi:uncharacterized iron-regulated protein
MPTYNETVFLSQCVGKTLAMMIKRFFLSAFFALFATGCVAQTVSADACVTPGKWYDPRTGAVVSTPQVLNRTKDLDVVLLGETHTANDHHRWQLQVMSQLYATTPGLVLGFEAFPRRVQPVLDQWVSGELSEAEFLKRSEWETVWKFDAELYLPLFHFARINHIPMVALNVDRSFINKVSKQGWQAIPPKDRLGLGERAEPSEDYLNMLGQIYAQHDDGKDRQNQPNLSDPKFSGFVDVQVTWDLAMAEAIRDALKAENATKMVAIIGRGHLEFNYGVPHQLVALGIDKVAVFSPWEAERPCSEFNNNLGQVVADAVFGLPQNQDNEPPAGPKLGVIIENNKDGDGVRIGGVLETSIAKASGLLKDDILTMAAGQPLKTTGDLIAIVKAMAPGTWLPLTLKRGEQTLQIVAHFPVTFEEPQHP